MFSIARYDVNAIITLTQYLINKRLLTILLSLPRLRSDILRISMRSSSSRPDNPPLAYRPLKPGGGKLVITTQSRVNTLM